MPAGWGGGVAELGQLSATETAAALFATLEALKFDKYAY